MQLRINTPFITFIVFYMCIHIGSVNAQSVYQSSANFPVCVGADTEFTYTGSCTPIQWRFEGSVTVVSSTNKKVVVRWNSATSIAAVAAMCSSTVTPSSTFSVSANVIPSVSISGPTSICGGLNTTYTAAPTNGGSSPFYTWMINGVEQPTQNGNTFSTTQLGVNNTVSVRMMSRHPCVATGNVFATSSSITISQVNALAPVSVSISGPSTICFSTIPTYTANAVNAGSSPVYKWFKDGIEVNDNELYQSPQYQYKPHYGLPNGGVITCMVTSSIACSSGNPASSNPINVTVTNDSPSLTLIVDRTTFCQGDAIKFRATSDFPITSYAWSIDNSVTLSTAAEFTQAQIFTGNVIHLATTISTSCGSVSRYATSNPVTVYPSLNSSIFPSGEKKVCFDCSQVITANPDVNYSYQWRKDEINIPFANSSTYSASDAGTYDVMVSRSLCDTKLSNPLTLTKNVRPIANAGPDKVIILPTNSSILEGSGYDPDGTIVSYLWTLVSGASSAILINQNTATLNVRNLSSGTYVFRLTVWDDFGDTGSDDVQIQINHPPNNYNWIKETKVLVADKKSIADVDILDQREREIGWQYFDGIGRPMQTVAQQGSPLGADIIQPIAYDQFGREVAKYLPYVSTGTNGFYKLSALNDQAGFYQTIYGNETPYVKTVFEPSPLNRVMKQGASGAAWQPVDEDPFSINDYTIKKRYEFNTINEVLHLKSEGATLIAEPKYYGENQLSVNKTYDETNNLIIEYVDKEGRTICKKVQSGGTPEAPQFASTYYIYDDLGNLVVVLPPEGVEKLKTALNLN